MNEDDDIIIALGGKPGDKLVTLPNGKYKLERGEAMQMSDVPTDPVQARSMAATQESQKLSMLDDPNATLRGQARSSMLGETQYQPLESAGYGAASAAFPTGASIVGGLLPTMATRALTSNPWAIGAAGLAGIPAAIVANRYANELQNTYLDPSLQAKIDLAGQQNPKSFKAGTVLPSLVAFGVSPSAIQSAGRVGRDVVSAVAGQGGVGTRAMLGNVGREAAASGDLANIVGGAIGAGIPAGMAYNQYRKTGEVDPFSAGVDVAAGLLINKPHKAFASSVNKLSRGPVMSSEGFVPRAGDELRSGLDMPALEMPVNEPDIPLAASRVIDNPEADALAKHMSAGKQAEISRQQAADKQAEKIANAQLKEQAKAERDQIAQLTKQARDEERLAKQIADTEAKRAKQQTAEQVKMGQQKLDFEKQYNDALAEQGKEPQYSTGENPLPAERISQQLSPEEQSKLQNKLGTNLSKQGSQVTAVEGSSYSTTDDPTVRAGKFNREDKSVEFTTDNPDNVAHEAIHLAVNKLSPEGQARFMKRVTENADYQVAKSKRPSLTPEEFVAEEGSVALAKQIKDKDFGLFRDLANIWKNVTGKSDLYDSMRSLGNVLAMGASKEGGSFNKSPLPAKPRDVGEAGVYQRYPETDKANIVPDTAETVAAQQKLALDKDSSRKAVLYTGGKHIGEVPVGLRRVVTNHGTVDYNPRKISESAVLNASNKGYEFDARVLGMSSANKPVDLTQAKVVSVDTDSAKNVQAEVVDEVSLSSATKAAQDAVPGGRVTVKEPEQLISERTGDTSEPLPDVQYSKLFKSTVDNVKDPDQRFAVRAAFNDAARLSGELGSNMNKIAGKLRKAGIDIKQLTDAYRSGKLLTTPEAREYYNEITRIANEANSGGVARTIKLKPGYVPEIFSREVTEILRKSSDSPEAKAVIDAIGKHWFDPAAAESLASHVYKQRTTNLDADFGPARKQAGLGLPDSVTVGGKKIQIRENDPVRALGSYTQRLAKDLSWYRNVESKYGRDIASEGMHDARTAYRGRYMDDSSQVLQQGMRAAGSMVTGTLTGVRNLLANPVQQAMYGGKDFPIKLAKSWIETATAYPSLRKEAIKRGVLRAGANQAEFNPNVDNPIAHGIKTFIDAKRLVDGSTALEDISRVQNMAFGKLAATDYINKALKGDKKALAAMERFGVKATDPEALKKLAPVIATTIEATYDPREQTTFMHDSTLGDIMSIHKWGYEKMLTFNKDAIQPALKGDLAPLFYAIAAAAGITIPAIEGLNEMARGRKGQPSLDEIGAAEGVTGEKKLAARLAWFTDKLTTAGLGGYGANLANAGAAVLNKRVDVKPIFVPIAEEAGNIKKLFTDTIATLNEGEPGMEVLKGFTTEALKIIFQAADPVIRKLGGNENAEEYGSDIRDKAVYDKLVNDKVPPQIESNKIAGRREKALKETVMGVHNLYGNQSEQNQILNDLLLSYVKQYGNDQVKIRGKINALKQASEGAFPGEGDEQAKFVRWLYAAYGSNEANNKIKRAQNRLMLRDEMKKKIPDVEESESLLK